MSQDKKGIPSLNCFLSAAALLPQLTLCCGGRQAQVMGGRSGTGDGIIVQCTCQECEDRVACMPRFHPPAGRWAKLMTLEVCRWPNIKPLRLCLGISPCSILLM